MKTMQLDDRKRDEIRKVHRRISHRPSIERLAFVNDWLKLDLSVDELNEIVSQQTNQTK